MNMMEKNSPWERFRLYIMLNEWRKRMYQLPVNKNYIVGFSCNPSARNDFILLCKGKNVPWKRQHKQDQHTVSPSLHWRTSSIYQCMPTLSTNMPNIGRTNEPIPFFSLSRRLSAQVTETDSSFDYDSRKKSGKYANSPAHTYSEHWLCDALLISIQCIKIKPYFLLQAALSTLFALQSKLDCVL